MVQRVTGVGLQEKVQQTVDNRGDGEDGLPIFTEDVKADIALKVDVGVVNLRLALDLRGLVRVQRGHVENKRVAGTFPEALIWSDRNVEVHEVVFVWEIDGDLRRQLHLVQFLLHPDLTWLSLLHRCLPLRALLGLLRALTATDAEDLDHGSKAWLLAIDRALHVTRARQKAPPGHTPTLPWVTARSSARAHTAPSCDSGA
mmetsp:Transcript_67489/g.170257  ORF Transcript_67489/g.170257 Transcript_67489/m.170257 type:complete len:201 (-) Transcript_67489:1-603(-)